MIAELESQIVELLRLRFDGTGQIVEPIADDVDAFDKLGARGAIIVRYIGEIYTPVVGASGYQRTWRFMIAIASKTFGRSTPDSGIYTTMDAIRGTLTGRRLAHADGMNTVRLIPESAGFIREQKKIWWYQITFSGKDSVIIP